MGDRHRAGAARIISQDLDGKILSWNQGASELFGFAPEEALGRPIEIVVPPDMRAEHQQSMQALRRGELVQHIDTFRMHKDGRRLEVSSRISPIRGGEGQVIGASKISHDISAQKRNERVLRLFSEAGTVLSALSEEASMLERLARLVVPLFADWCVVSLIEAHGEVRVVGRAHSDPAMRGVLDEYLARYPLDLNNTSITVNVLRSGQPELISDMPSTVLDALATDVQHRELLSKLSPRSVLVVPITIRGKTVGAISFALNSSFRRYSVDDMAVASELSRRAATAIENARLYQELQEAQRQKDDFLAMLAHELRNPLAAIQYANQIAHLSQTPSEEAGDTIDRQVKNLAHLIDDLLDVSRITRDKIHLQKEHIDGASLVRRAAASIQSVIAGRKHELSVEISPEPLPLLVDPTRLEQILVNLLSNAAKYTPEGGKIVLRSFADGRQAVFQVQDNGIGIPTESLPRVFELFTQVDRSLDRSQGGLGIGLTVVRRLAEMHGGSVAADSPGLGQGSLFTVRLPLCEAPADASTPRSARPQSTQPRRILVVDDNVDTAISVATLLKLAGHQVSLAHDGLAAIDAAKATRPEIVLLDIGLPGLDGYAVARTLRDDPEFSRAKLIAVSGYGQPEDRRRAHEAGFDEHLVKPVAFDKLLSLID